jgi:hypothetical protein
VLDSARVQTFAPLHGGIYRNFKPVPASLATTSTMSRSEDNPGDHGVNSRTTSPFEDVSLQREAALHAQIARMREIRNARAAALPSAYGVYRDKEVALKDASLSSAGSNDHSFEPMLPPTPPAQRLQHGPAHVPAPPPKDQVAISPSESAIVDFFKKLQLAIPAPATSGPHHDSGRPKTFKLPPPVKLQAAPIMPAELTAWFTQLADCFVASGLGTDEMGLKGRAAFLRSVIHADIAAWLETTIGWVSVEALLRDPATLHNLFARRWVEKDARKQLRARVQALKIVGNSLMRYAIDLRRDITELSLLGDSGFSDDSLKEILKAAIDNWDAQLWVTMVGQLTKPLEEHSFDELLGRLDRLHVNLGSDRASLTRHVPSSRSAAGLAVPYKQASSTPSSASSWRSTSPPRPLTAPASAAPSAATLATLSTLHAMTKASVLTFQARFPAGTVPRPLRDPKADWSNKTCFNCVQVGHHASLCRNPRLDLAATLKINAGAAQTFAQVFGALAVTPESEEQDFEDDEE